MYITYIVQCLALREEGKREGGGKGGGGDYVRHGERNKSQEGRDVRGECVGGWWEMVK